MIFVISPTTSVARTLVVTRSPSWFTVVPVRNVVYCVSTCTLMVGPEPSSFALARSRVVKLIAMISSATGERVTGTSTELILVLIAGEAGNGETVLTNVIVVFGE